MGLRYAKPVLRREFREYTEWSLREVKAAWRNQRRIAPELLLNRQTYRDVLQCNDRTSDRQFMAFDFTEKGVVSALIVFGTVLLLSKGDATDKLQFIFSMFDFANKGKTTMNPDEIMLMIRCSMKGLCRVKAMEEPPEEYYHGLLREMFTELKIEPFEPVQMEAFMVWFKKDVRRSAVLDTSTKNLAKLGNLVARQRELMDELAIIVAKLQAEGEQVNFQALELGQDFIPQRVVDAEQQPLDMGRTLEQPDMVTVTATAAPRPKPKGLSGIFHVKTRAAKLEPPTDGEHKAPDSADGSAQEATPSQELPQAAPPPPEESKGPDGKGSFAEFLKAAEAAAQAAAAQASAVAAAQVMRFAVELTQSISPVLVRALGVQYCAELTDHQVEHACAVLSLACELPPAVIQAHTYSLMEAATVVSIVGVGSRDAPSSPSPPPSPQRGIFGAQSPSLSNEEFEARQAAKAARAAANAARIAEAWAQHRDYLLKVQIELRSRFDSHVIRVFEHWLSRSVLTSTTVSPWVRWAAASRLFCVRAARHAAEYWVPHLLALGPAHQAIAPSLPQVALLGAEADATATAADATVAGGEQEADSAVTQTVTSRGSGRFIVDVEVDGGGVPFDTLPSAVLAPPPAPATPQPAAAGSGHPATPGGQAKSGRRRSIVGKRRISIIGNNELDIEGTKELRRASLTEGTPAAGAAVAAGAAAAGAAASGEKRFSLVFESQTRVEMPPPPKVVTTLMKEETLDPALPTASAAPSILSPKDNLSQALGMTSAFGTAKSVEEMAALEERASKVSSKSLRMRQQRQRFEKPRETVTAEAIAAKTATKKKRMKKPPHPYGSFLSFDFLAQRDSTLSQVREIATAMEEVLKQPYIWARLVWIADAYTVRVVTEAGLTAVRVVLFRKDDIFTRLLKYLGGPLASVLGKDAVLKARMDVIFTAEGLATVQKYDRYYKNLCVGKYQKSMTPFAVQAVTDIVSEFDGTMTAALPVGAVNAMQARLRRLSLPTWSCLPPLPFGNLPEPLTAEYAERSLQLYRWDPRIVAALSASLVKRVFKFDDYKAARGPGRRKLGDIVSRAAIPEGGEQPEVRAAREAFEAEIRAAQAVMVTYSPWRPVFYSADDMRQALSATEGAIVDAQGRLPLASIVAAYKRAMCGEGVMSLEDMLDPALAALAGDAGKELASDMRSARIGSLDNVLRARLSLIAELPLGAMVQLDKLRQASFRNTSSVGNPLPYILASPVAQLEPYLAPQVDGRFNLKDAAGPVPSSALMWFLSKCLEGGTVRFSVDHLSDLIPAEILPPWFTEPGGGARLLRHIRKAVTEWNDNVTKTIAELERAKRGIRRRAQRTRGAPEPVVGDASDSDRDEEPGSLADIQQCLGYFCDLVDTIIDQVNDDVGPCEGTHRPGRGKAKRGPKKRRKPPQPTPAHVASLEQAQDDQSQAAVAIKKLLDMLLVHMTGPTRVSVGNASQEWILSLFDLDLLTLFCDQLRPRTAE